MEKLIIRRAALLGAGVMGAQIAAHLANADVPVVLFDLPAKEGDRKLAKLATRSAPPARSARRPSCMACGAPADATAW